MATSEQDLVYFPDIVVTDIGKIVEMASKACNEGSMTIQDYRQFRALCYETEWFNKVVLADGT